MHLQEPTNRKRLLVLVLVLVMVGVVSAGVFLASRPGSEGDLTPAVIRVGVLPDMDREELLRRCLIICPRRPASPSSWPPPNPTTNWSSFFGTGRWIWPISGD